MSLPLLFFPQMSQKFLKRNATFLGEVCESMQKQWRIFFPFHVTLGAP